MLYHLYDCYYYAASLIKAPYTLPIHPCYIRLVPYLSSFSPQASPPNPSIIYPLCSPDPCASQLYSSTTNHPSIRDKPLALPFSFCFLLLIQSPLPTTPVHACTCMYEHLPRRTNSFWT
ncbi:hypothetical protein BDBG_17402 [Blastomyces gilchristii SLH14081]|uniref:Uncharacterized protein n=1 Tax=Blastomyces gilchristii (strain SLH14081) TaxID=559298 RepID=A0A179UU63_BLAGS|nr:uncharacterized protein BDBG_17402 [Blastomyces gilchristii SLH14081]OAT10698.1 hypothetical protein BDBG_17402 [Blastomyces gilchristii SLH14081]